MIGAQSPLLHGLFGDAEVEAALSDAALLAALLEAEAALAAAQAELGLVPTAAAEAIAALDRPEPEDLVAATARDGVVVPGFVAALRARLPAAHAPYLHWGATSQDILDTAVSLQLRAVLAILEGRLTSVMDSLAGLAGGHRGTVMAARTRHQQATPTTFGLVAAEWLMPLVRLAAKLPALRGEVLRVSLGGASGTQAALGSQAPAIAARMAACLGLAEAPLPWHAQREGMLELGGWVVQLSGALGKLAGDAILLAQTEVGELRLEGAGGSSTMPHKQNPTAAEAVVALARANAHRLGALAAAQLHAQQRDGAAWQLEWQMLPEIAQASGAALLRTRDLLEALQPQPARMRANLEASGGLYAAEAISFALAEHMPRPEAQALVKAACRESVETGMPLITVLRGQTDAPLAWERLGDHLTQVGNAEPLIDAALAAHAALRPTESAV